MLTLLHPMNHNLQTPHNYNAPQNNYQLELSEQNVYHDENSYEGSIGSNPASPPTKLSSSVPTESFTDSKLLKIETSKNAKKGKYYPRLSPSLSPSTGPTGVVKRTQLTWTDKQKKCKKCDEMTTSSCCPTCKKVHTLEVQCPVCDRWVLYTTVLKHMRSEHPEQNIPIGHSNNHPRTPSDAAKRKRSASLPPIPTGKTLGKRSPPCASVVTPVTQDSPVISPMEPLENSAMKKQKLIHGASSLPTESHFFKHLLSGQSSSSSQPLVHSSSTPNYVLLNNPELVGSQPSISTSPVDLISTTKKSTATTSSKLGLMPNSSHSGSSSDYLFANLPQSNHSHSSNFFGFSPSPQPSMLLMNQEHHNNNNNAVYDSFLKSVFDPMSEELPFASNSTNSVMSNSSNSNTSSSTWESMSLPQHFDQTHSTTSFLDMEPTNFSMLSNNNISVSNNSNTTKESFLSSAPLVTHLIVDPLASLDPSSTEVHAELDSLKRLYITRVAPTMTLSEIIERVHRAIVESNAPLDHYQLQQLRYTFKPSIL